MASGGWKEFTSRQDDKVRFDILEGRYLRIRSRKSDRDGKRAFLIIDLLTLRELEIELYRDGKLSDVVYLVSDKSQRTSTKKEVRELRA